MNEWIKGQYTISIQIYYILLIMNFWWGMIKVTTITTVCWHVCCHVREKKRKNEKSSRKKGDHRRNQLSRSRSSSCVLSSAAAFSEALEIRIIRCISSRSLYSLFSLSCMPYYCAWWSDDGRKTTKASSEEREHTWRRHNDILKALLTNNYPSSWCTEHNNEAILTRGPKTRFLRPQIAISKPPFWRPRSFFSLSLSSKKMPPHLCKAILVAHG
jgi:hypothetical protein